MKLAARGYSLRRALVGHWDGDTLVAESFGFNNRTWLDRRSNFGNLDVEVTFSDPEA